MLTHDEGTLASQDGPQQSQGAEVAVRHPDLILVDQRVDVGQQSTFLGVAILTQRCPQGVEDGCDAEGGVVNEGSRDRQFDVRELVVNRLIADRELVVELTVGSRDGRLLAEDNPCHQIDEGGAP